MTSAAHVCNRSIAVRSEELTLNAILFLFPTAVGAALAIAYVALCRILPRRLKFTWLAPFLSAFGLGIGLAAMALDARGLRLPMIEWVQTAKERHFRDSLRQKADQRLPD